MNDARAGEMAGTTVGTMTAPAVAPWWGLVDDGRLRLDYAMKILETASSLERAIVAGAAEPLDLLVERYRKTRGKMGSNDRRVLSLGVYGLARSRDAIVKVAGKRVGQGGLLALGLLDQLAAKQLTDIPEQFQAVYPLLDELRGFRENALTAIEAEGSKSPSKVSAKARQLFAMLFSVPEFWLESGHWATLGEAAQKLAGARREQTVQLRVNSRKATRDEVVSGLISEGYGATATKYSPWGISLDKRVNLNSWPLYKDGVVEVQDEGSQLVALLCEPIGEGAEILDLCAGAGGKTLALAALVPPNARVWAFDSDQKRLSRMIPRVERGGFSFDNLRLIGKEDELKPEGYELVVVDAPCSSSGTLRRNPDIAWRWKREQLKEFQEVQYALLTTAAALLKPGGTLVYSTCSIFEAENTDVVASFIERNEGYSLSPYTGSALLAEVAGTQTGEVWLDSALPGYMGDGFYCARIKKGGQTL